jgi:hypothetical protein
MVEYTCTGTFCHVAKCSDTLNVRQVPRPDFRLDREDAVHLFHAAHAC